MTSESAPTLGSAARSARSWARNISNASRLALSILAITVASLLVTLVVSLTFGEDLDAEVIEGKLESQLTLKADGVEALFATTEIQVAALAGSGRISDAVSRFAGAYAELSAADESDLSEAAADVDEFYRDEFAPQLEATLGVATAWPTLRPTTDNATYLQAHYVATGSGDVASRRSVNDAGDGSAWSAVHREVHGGLLGISEQLGIGDLLLIDADSGVIVYSVAKDPDFATSVDTGPHSGSTLADLARQIREDPSAGAVVADIASYLPAQGRPVGFIGAPVFDDGRLEGILVFRFPVDRLDDLMTSSGQWEALGFGESGETFLLGGDGRMRSVSRAFVEDRSGYLARVSDADTATAEEMAAMSGTGTTITFQKVVAQRTLEDIAGFEMRSEPSNYLGSEVLTAYQALDLDDVDWYVAAQMELGEIERPISEFRRSLLIAVAVYVVLITFATAAWARGVFRPLRGIGAALRRIYEGEPAAPLDVPDRAASEFGDLTRSVDAMLAASHARQQRLAEATEQRLQVMRSFLPASVADRLEAGSKRVVDSIAQVSVVVLVVHGLGDLMRSTGVEDYREQLDHLVSELHSIARMHGVEPVKLVGDAYFAGCGLDQPYLDHAPRAVAFALEACELVAADDLRIAAGLHSGPVTVGLSGSSLLVYDLWGDTVATAQSLARAAGPGQVLATDEVRGMLPATHRVRGWQSHGIDAWEVFGRETAEEGAE